MLSTIERDAVEQLRVLAHLHRGGKPNRASLYRQFADQLAYGDPNKVISHFRQKLVVHEAALATALTETEKRMGPSSSRLEHMDEEQECRIVLEAVAATFGNRRVWGEAWGHQNFKQIIRIFQYADRQIQPTSVGSGMKWAQAAQWFNAGSPEQLLSLVMAEKSPENEILNILRARRVVQL